MSNNWRASLVPAAAVIPAPRAYTNIAAVKTLVVCHWVAGLPGGRAAVRRPAPAPFRRPSGRAGRAGGRSRPRCGQNPWWYAPAPAKFARDGEICSCPKAPFTGGPQRARPERRCGQPQADRRPHVPVPGTLCNRPSTTGAHRHRHRGKLSVPKASTTRLDARPWHVNVPTKRGTVELCWPWRPLWAMWCVHRRPPSATRPLGSVLGTSLAGARRGGHGGPWGRWASGSAHRPNPMGPVRVKGTSAPEVKFLDRRKTTGGEGALQGCVRRSRTRVRGAKMIRHRRSPAPSTVPARPPRGNTIDPAGATPPPTRNPSPWVPGGVLSQG